MPSELIKGVKEVLGWQNPSKIQAVAIPLIVNINEEKKQVDNMLVSSKYGSGKTGAFVIGSLLRINPKINKTQVLVICHKRELANQTSEVYHKAMLPHTKSVIS